MALAFLTRAITRQTKHPERHCKRRAENTYQPAAVIPWPSDPLKRHLAMERFGYILQNTARWRSSNEWEFCHQAATAAVDERFAQVPEGFASLPQTLTDFAGCPEVDINTEAFLLARCVITNRQFQAFVDAGGYDDLELWPRDIWPHLIDFRDQSGTAAPRFWHDGRHDERLAEHPVVGVCYYEAAAYARWVGYALPDEAQWQMAASWRIRSAANTLRRYPWGDALDTARCNIWASGIGHTVAVDQYPTGAAPNGVLQLIGNVWEWTCSDFNITDDEGRPIIGSMCMKSIRGGAYDTYFPTQATSGFRTGLPAMARVHNVGFRCVYPNLNRSSSGKGTP